MLLLTLGAFALAADPAQACGRGHRGKMGGKMGAKRVERLKAKLGLSDAQVQQIKTIRSEARAQAKPYRDQIKPLRQQMKALLAADPVNEAQVVALHSRMRQLRQLIGEQRFQGRLKFLRVLTKEQRSKLAQLRGKRWGKHGKGKHGQGKRGHGQWGRNGSPPTAL